MSETLQAIASIPQASPGAFFEEHRQEIMAAVSRVLDSGWYILGREVDAFEREFAAHFEFAAAAGVGNGTDALTLALRALGVGKGDRVATVSHTAVATVAAIEMTGASPVFVDIDAGSFTMDIDSLARTLRAHAPIKAVIAVHLYGNSANMPAIVALAREAGARVIEDCAQSHGARLHGQFLGGLGDASTFSFYPTKNLGALGDGGMVASTDPACIQRVKALREYGWERRYISDKPGINSRLDEVQAAILRVRLPYLDECNRRRAAIAAVYDEAFSDQAFEEIGLKLPVPRPGTDHVYHQYVVRHPERDQFQKRLKERGIGTNIHYPVPAHRQPAYEGRCAMDPHGLGTTEAVGTQILSLPMYPELNDASVESIVTAVRDTV